jgi:hypothetical protein
MKKKRKKKPDPTWWARHREQFERTDRLLRERIGYHNAKLRGAPGLGPAAVHRGVAGVLRGEVGC